ncbi:MAG TPA: AAA family ATPase [Candidatus Binatia bacterium]
MSELQRSRFVGRDPELALLRSGLDAALRGEGQLVALVGDAGIGKTRTAAFLAGDARARGMSVVWGRCHEGGAAPAYWPWTQALGAFAAAIEEGVSGAAAVTSSAVAMRLAGAVALLREGSDAADASELPARARFALLDGVTTALVAAVRGRPLLLVLDDLHWADVGSLLLLQLVARELDGCPLLVLVTLRDLELRQRPEAGALVQDALRHGRQVVLGGLPRQAVQELLTDRLGAAPADELVDHVVATSEGNPFFVLEMAQLVASAGRGGVPAGAAALLRRRLAPLPPDALRVLQAAAVVGREFDLETLGCVLDAAPENLLDALAQPLALGLVRAVPGRLRRYAFGHVLLRDTLYDDLAPSERARLHAAAGRALARDVDAPVDDDDRLALLAHHFLAAADGGGDAREAVRWACAAGERALELLAFEEAARHFERALSALEVAPDRTLRLRVLVGLGRALHATGEQSRAEVVLRDAVVLARREGTETFAQTALRCAAVRAEIGVLDVESNDLLEEALATLPPGASALRARVMARLAAGLLLAPGSHERRRALADEATAMARELGDPPTLAFVLARRLTALLGPDNLAERSATIDEIVRSRRNAPAAELDALVFRIGDLAELGDRAGLDHAFTIFEQRLRAAREPFLRWSLASFHTAIALLEGRYADAEALAAEALRLGGQAQARTAVLNYAQQLFLLRGEQGRLAEVEPLVVASVSETAIVPAWRCGLADFYAASGRLAEARRELDALASDGFASLPRDSTWLTALVLLSSVCCRLGDERRAELLYDLLRPYAGRVAIARPLVVLVGTVDDRLGQLAGLLGRFDDAERHFADALALAERMRAAPWQAHVRHAWAGMLLRRGDADARRRAHALLDEAERIARPLGMGLLLGWVEERRAAADAAEHAAHDEHAPAVARESAHAASPGHAAAPHPAASLAPAAATSAIADATRSAATFRRDGDVWTLVFEGRMTRLPHMIGLAHLARLLAEPTREVHVTDLIDAAYARQRNGSMRELVWGDAGEELDAQAREQYTARLQQARVELDEATAANDRGRMERLENEIGMLEDELSRSYGLDGRARRARVVHERARVAVTRAIKYAIGRIGQHDARLAEHLRLAVRTGLFCSYQPPSRERVDWAL